MGSDARFVRGATQKELVKAFESLCGRHGRWEVWADWIGMCARSISNAVDRAHRNEREKTYKTLSEKYTEAERQTMAEMLGMVVAVLDENQDQDLLGEIFMTLGLGNEHNGQFFTPYNVCCAMSALNSVSLLVLDDLDIERQSEYMQETVYNVIDGRYRAGKPVIVTTNLTAEQLKNPSNVDKRRVYSRLMDMCIPVPVSGEDRRYKRAPASLAEDMAILNGKI